MEDNESGPVGGIPCLLVTPAARDALRDVLAQVCTGFPADGERIGRVVTGVEPLSAAEAEDGTQGEWRRTGRPESGKPETWDFGVGETPGVLLVNEGLSDWELRAVLAHELGHACTVQEDRDRTGALSDEWASEAAADCYAYKWGYGPLIAQQERDSSHHGARPNEVVSMPWGDGRTTFYQYTLAFRYVEISPEEADAIRAGAAGGEAVPEEVARVEGEK